MTSDPTLTTAACPCGAPPFAIRPGLEPVRLDAIDLFTRRQKATEAGVACVVLCRTCWLKRFGRRVDAAIM
jgi:hypothetical protein